MRIYRGYEKTATGHQSTGCLSFYLRQTLAQCMPSFSLCVGLCAVRSHLKI